ncbi:intermembrane transport protein PqiB [Alishewanella sp. 16-MA]|uniref:Intermembrane transport protein PqiB n=1 Tax=Alishewanella maricola TaxID=2795740 RepID=A0ABS8BZT7_9ALTE|nr:intermembrane transport protein PqiB [Alishewanella maricola]
MTEAELVQAEVSPIKQWSPIWVVPIVAILIGLWMLYNHFQQQGAMLLLVAENAEGIVAGKTQIKNRNVDVGQVVSVELSEDLSQVMIKARMKPNVTPLLNEASQFWVVKPQIGRGGVTGLNTLMSGSYIELQPGDATRVVLTHPLLNTPPVASADAPGVRVKLQTSDAGGLTIGDPVLYRGYEVGTVESSEFELSTRSTHYQLYIKQPFDVLVTENVRFWLSSGLSIDLSAEGLSVDVGSAATLLSGGVSFDVLDGWPVGAAAENGTEFQLFPDKQSIQDGMYYQFVEYLVFFDESVRGLKAGAPVEFRGVRVGTVTSVPFFFAMKKPFEVSLNQGVPVLLRIEAGRLYENLTLAQLGNELSQAVSRGLHAVLKTGNLLTGALYVDLDINSELLADSRQQALYNEQLLLSRQAGYPSLPSARSGFSNIEQKVLMALDKVNNLQLEEFLTQGQQTLAATEQMLASSEQLLATLQQFVSKPELQQLPSELQQSLNDLRQALAGVSPGSTAYERAGMNLQMMDQVLRELQPVLKMLNQQSNALLINASDNADPQPRKAQQ